MIKRSFASLILAFLLAASEAIAAKYEDLSERSAGRVLCVCMRNKEYQFFIFVCPMPMDTWICREYLSGKEGEVDPKFFELMPFYEQDDDFAIEVLTCWYLLHDAPESPRYRAIAQLVDLPRIARTRNFLEIVRRQGNEIARLRREGATGEISDIINNGEALRELTAVVRDKHDYFLAVEFLRYYRLQVNRWLGYSNADYSDVVQNLEIVGQDIVTYYRSDHEKVSLKSEFARVCPRQRGLWKQAVPLTFNEMIRRNAAAFESWQKSRELSPDCDFPEWGNYMLDILSMMPGSGDNDPAVVQFKNALKQYQDAFADGVN